jgi:hypothetical protein
MAADAAKRNSFRAAKNQKIASDFLIFCRSIQFYLPPQAAIRLMRQSLTTRIHVKQSKFVSKKNF